MVQVAPEQEVPASPVACLSVFLASARACSTCARPTDTAARRARASGTGQGPSPYSGPPPGTLPQLRPDSPPRRAGRASKAKFRWRVSEGRREGRRARAREPGRDILDRVGKAHLTRPCVVCVCVCLCVGTCVFCVTLSLSAFVAGRVGPGGPGGPSGPGGGRRHMEDCPEVLPVMSS